MQISPKSEFASISTEGFTKSQLFTVISICFASVFGVIILLYCLKFRNNTDTDSTMRKRGTDSLRMDTGGSAEDENSFSKGTFSIKFEKQNRKRQK
jgi:hypothetical protein